MSEILFCDVETTGLSLEDDIWEFAAITESGAECQFFIEHDLSKAAALPESFRADHDKRYYDREALTRRDAAEAIWTLTDGAHIAGAVPNFDTERLALLLRAHGYEPAWHYHVICVEVLAVGWLHAAAQVRGAPPHPAVLTLPWDSDALSVALGVTAPAGDRHTAIGDARWAKAIWEAVTGTKDGP